MDFDFIIVGAGSAGCVLANRLTEDQSSSVLLIESGREFRNPLVSVPIAIPLFFGDPTINWNYKSEREKGAANRSIDLPRGRLLGGCSMINGMTYARGHRLDYDGWEKVGARGWSYADVLPYFRKLEDSWIDDDVYHGHGGPVGVQGAFCNSLLFGELQQACNALGIPTTRDYHGKHSEGLARQELTTARGRRASTAKAYIEPVRKRHNLTITTEALARRILLDGSVATGVEYEHRGQLQTATARREVIVSAGSYNTPHLLMLSGIGPAEMLRQAGVTPLFDVQGVGANLTEHILALVDFKTSLSSFHLNFRSDRAATATLRWALRGDGPFSTNGCSANIFARSSLASDRPDLQLMCMAVSLGSSIWHPWSKRPDGVVGAYVTALQPKSRGTVSLTSPSAATPPRISLNLLDHPDDMQCMIEGIRLTRKIYSQDPFASSGISEISPGDAVSTDDEIASYVRQSVQLGHHPVSTCRMGEDELAVVDSSLRVRGVDRLRVVDASIMPTIPGGNTNVPTIMIAERAADLIRGRSPDV